MIYLDNAATTFPKPEEVYSMVDHIQRNLAVNVGRGSYQAATDAMKIVDETRFLMAELLNANNPNNIIFAPSATIAANQIIMGLEWDQYKVVYVTPFEHNAIARPLEIIKQKYNITLLQLPFDGATQKLDFEQMEQDFALNPPDYVFINHISNVTGAVLPVDIVTAASKAYNATVIVDGSQSVGLLEYNLKKSQFDYLIFAGHKNLYASWGIGGFIKNSSHRLINAFAGGTGSDSLNLSMGDSYPSSFEFGSPNIIAIASLNASLKWLKEIGIDTIAKKKKHLMNRLIEGLKSLPVVLYTPAEDIEHTSVVSFTVHDYEPSEVGAILSGDFDIAVRTGFHCAPFIHELIDTKGTPGTVRVSLGYFNTENDIDCLLESLRSL